MMENGVSKVTIDALAYVGINSNDWLKRIDSIPDSVRQSVEMIRNHPLLPKSIRVHGLVIDPETGKLDLIVNGNEQQ